MKKKKYFKNRISKLLIIPLIFIFLIIIAGVLYLNGGISGKAAGIIGFSVYNTEETILEKYDSESANLSIKEPAKSGLLGLGEAVTKNKNRRMDFNLSGGGLRLYFDLLNYSEFVEGVAETNAISVMPYKEELASELKNATEDVTNKSGIIDNSTKQENNETFINDTENNENQIPINNESQDIVNVTPEDSEQSSLVNETNEQTPVEVSNLSSETEVSEKKAEITQITQTEETSDAENSNEEVKPGITGFFARFFGMGRVIGLDENNTENLTSEIPTTNNQTIPQTIPTAENTVSVDVNEIKDILNNLTSEKVEEIADNSVIPAESFDINVNASKIEDIKPEYKWGYKVKLNDLKFMAKIEITSNESISKYNENTLKIGKRNMLSFEDLTNAGYKVRIEKPSLEIPINVSVNLNRVMRNITAVNETIEEIINETILNVTEVNQTELNITEINATEPIINQTELNITIPNRAITNATEVNATETNFTIINETEANNETANNPIINDSEEKENQGSEDIIINETNEDKENGNKEEKEAVEKKNEKEKEEAIKEKEKEDKKGNIVKEEKKEEKTEEEQAPQGITGNTIRFFRLTGKAIFGMGRAIALSGKAIIGIDENITEIEDIKYANTITVYIERDFSAVSGESQVVGGNETTNNKQQTTNIDYEDLDGDGKISAGDIINLDPSLIIILITNAEELDSNRSYIRNIYESVKEKDDNWSEVINNSNYVRATFEKALGKNNDITVFARASGWTNESNITGAIEIYKQDGNSLIAKIENITSEGWYKTYLDGEHGGIGLSDNETSDVFDLKIMNAENVLVNNSVNINGQDVPYDIYQKKKRIDEINALLNGG